MVLRVAQMSAAMARPMFRQYSRVIAVWQMGRCNGHEMVQLVFSQFPSGSEE
jgi:hypothetical protein